MTISLEELINFGLNMRRILSLRVINLMCAIIIINLRHYVPVSFRRKAFVFVINTPHSRIREVRGLWLLECGKRRYTNIRMWEKKVKNRKSRK